MAEFDHYYTNHIAKKIELDTLTVIDYYDPEKDYEYNLRFLFDKRIHPWLSLVILVN
ncbi:hypothetical protein ABG812_04625 [Streptococcus iniae]